MLNTLRGQNPPLLGSAVGIAGFLLLWIAGFLAEQFRFPISFDPAFVLANIVSVVLLFVLLRQGNNMLAVVFLLYTYLVFIVVVQAWEVRRILRGDFISGRQQQDTASG